MPKTPTIEQFIKNAKRVHGDKYDYSKSVYTKIHDKIKIIRHETDNFIKVGVTKRTIKSTML